MRIEGYAPVSFRGSRVVLLIAVSLHILASPLSAAVPFNVGDVFAGIGNGRYNHFSPTGTLLETLNDTRDNFNTTGMCFDSAGNMYGTNLSANSKAKFGPNFYALRILPNGDVLAAAGPSVRAGRDQASDRGRTRPSRSPVRRKALIPRWRGATVRARRRNCPV